jgi:hypothetical protein
MPKLFNAPITGKETTTMKQFLVTPAAGKRLIGKALAKHPEILKVLQSGTIVIIAGTTNGYVAEEILTAMGQANNFSRKSFFRGVTLPPTYPASAAGKTPPASEVPCDVVIVKGVWQKGKTIFDVAGDLREGDIILKGANALDLLRKRAAIYIAHPQAGTTGAILPAVAGRRVRLMIPVGLEKRVYGDIDDLAAKINAPGVQGPRLLPVPGEVFTELDAIFTLTGASAQLIAAGGICGAEGSVWVVVSGKSSQVYAAEELLKAVAAEPAFAF